MGLGGKWRCLDIPGRNGFGILINMEFAVMLAKALLALLWRWAQFLLLFLPLPAAVFFVAHVRTKKKHVVAAAVALGLLVNISAVLWAAEHPAVTVPEGSAAQLSEADLAKLRKSEAGVTWLMGCPAIPIRVTVEQAEPSGPIRTRTLCFPLGGWRTSHADGLSREDLWAAGLKESP